MTPKQYLKKRLLKITKKISDNEISSKVAKAINYQDMRWMYIDQWFSSHPIVAMILHPLSKKASRNQKETMTSLWGVTPPTWGNPQGHSGISSCPAVPKIDVSFREEDLQKVKDGTHVWASVVGDDVEYQQVAVPLAPAARKNYDLRIIHKNGELLAVNTKKEIFTDEKGVRFSREELIYPFLTKGIIPAESEWEEILHPFPTKGIMPAESETVKIQGDMGDAPKNPDPLKIKS